MGMVACFDAPGAAGLSRLRMHTANGWTASMLIPNSKKGMICLGKLASKAPTNSMAERTLKLQGKHDIAERGSQAER